MDSQETLQLGGYILYLLIIISIFVFFIRAILAFKARVYVDMDSSEKKEARGKLLKTTLILVGVILIFKVLISSITAGLDSGSGNATNFWRGLSGQAITNTSIDGLTILVVIANTLIVLGLGTVEVIALYWIIKSFISHKRESRTYSKEQRRDSLKLWVNNYLVLWLIIILFAMILNLATSTITLENSNTTMQAVELIPFVKPINVVINLVGWAIDGFANDSNNLFDILGIKNATNIAP